MRKINRISLVLTSCTVLGLAISKPVAAVTMYSITDLGDYNFLIPEGNSINDNGQVVGSFVNSSGDYRAFVWDSTNGIQDLGTLRNDGSGISFGQAINNNGQVVGFSSTDSGRDCAFLWDSTKGMQNLCTLNSYIKGYEDENYSFATDINNNGQVVGNWSSFDNFGLQAFVWDSTNGRQNLGTLLKDSFFYSKATSINDKTQVVGDSATRIDAEPGYDPRAFLWDSTNGIQNLGTLSSISSIGDSFATNINNQGQVVGYSRITAGASHAFLWDSINGMQDLGTLYPSSIGNPSFGLGLNDKGQVVGTSYSPETNNHAFVWENGLMTDLNTLRDPDFGFTLSQAQAINNKGQIVATSLLTSSVRAFVLTPISQPPERVPEPASTLSLLAFGAVAAGSVFKRKQKKQLNSAS